MTPQAIRFTQEILTNTQLPEKLMVYDKEWLDREIQKLVDEHNSTNDEDDRILCRTIKKNFFWFEKIFFS